jgi:hypothetical protein
MRMRARFLFAIFSVYATLGSVRAFAQKLYPVQGPLMSQPTPAVPSAQVRRPVVSVGGQPKLLKSWTLANGEVLKGKCVLVKASALNIKLPGTPDSYPPQPNLAFAWDAVYGQGYFAARILGLQFWQGIFTGNKGTVLQVEILDSQHGVAVDNKDNVYKFVW